MTDQTKPTPTLEYLRARRDEIIAIAQQYGASNVRVFGSVARGEATPESDVDFLVNLPPNASLFDLSGLWQDLQDLLGYAVDIIEDHPKLKPRFKQRIFKDIVSL